MRDNSVEGQTTWKEPAKSAVKKAQGIFNKHKEKVQKQHAAEEESRKQREKALEQAKSVVVKEDTSLPKPVKMRIGNKNVELGDGTTKGTPGKGVWQGSSAQTPKTCYFHHPG